MVLTQQAMAVLKGVIKRMMPCFIGIGMLTVMLAGCATLDIFGKEEQERLAREKANIEQQLTTCKADMDKLASAKAELEKQYSSEKAELEKQHSSEKAELEKKVAECKEQIGKLEKEKTKAKGLSVILFGGDIIYEVAADTFKEYKAALRYRSLNNPNFATALKMFEEGKGGDAEVLILLKETDTSGDRFIDADEASRLRKVEEDKYGEMRLKTK